MTDNEIIKKIKELFGIKSNDASKEASNVLSDELKNDSVSKEGVHTDEVKNTEENKETESENKEENKMAFVAPKVDKNGFIDLTNVEDADLKAFFKILNDTRKVELQTRKAEADKRLIDDSVKSAVSGLKLNKGITADAVSKLLDLTNVKVGEDGKVTGIEDAIKGLQTSQAGLFLADKEAKSNPVLEGHNPVENSATAGNYTPVSFAEAFNMMEA